MDEKYELKTLKQVIRLVDEADRQQKLVQLMKVGMYLATAILIIAAYILVSREVISGKVAVIVAAFGGTFAGVGAYVSVCQKQWPVIRQYLNIESIRRRLNELKT